MPYIPRPKSELITGTGSFVEAQTQVQKFFTGGDEDSENPSDTPNWYYYWSMSPASYGQHSYGPPIQLSYIGSTVWSEEDAKWRSWIHHGANDPYVPIQGAFASIMVEFIDTFALVTRHEARHVEHSTPWWPNGWVKEDDGDCDCIPDGLEPDDKTEDSLGGTWEHPKDGGPFVWGNSDTDDDGESDCEDYCWHTMARWEQFSARQYDWAHPGSQWR
jgi:hypothetical protein